MRTMMTIQDVAEKTISASKNSFKKTKDAYEDAGGIDALKAKTIEISKKGYKKTKDAFENAGGTELIKAKASTTIKGIKGAFDEESSFEKTFSKSEPTKVIESDGRMNFDWENWTIGGKIIFVSACVAVASMFMKWVDVGFVSQSGLSQGAYFFLGYWVYPVIKLFEKKTISKIWGLICSIASVISASVYISSKSIDMLGNNINAAASGPYLFLFASIALIYGIVKYSESPDNNNIQR